MGCIVIGNVIEAHANVLGRGARVLGAAGPRGYRRVDSECLRRPHNPAPPCIAPRSADKTRLPVSRAIKTASATLLSIQVSGIWAQRRMFLQPSHSCTILLINVYIPLRPTLVETCPVNLFHLSTNLINPRPIFTPSSSILMSQ